MLVSLSVLIIARLTSHSRSNNRGHVTKREWSSNWRVCFIWYLIL